jgi:hypothetical protein
VNQGHRKIESYNEALKRELEIEIQVYEGCPLPLASFRHAHMTWNLFLVGLDLGSSMQGDSLLSFFLDSAGV